jgi:hypothetical protein
VKHRTKMYVEWMKRLVFVLALQLTIGCFSTARIPTEELRHLDGFDAHNESMMAVPTTHTSRNANGTSTTSHGVAAIPTSQFRMVTSDGEGVTYTSNVELVLKLRNPNDELVHRFRSIQVSDLEFRGVTMEGAKTVQIPMENVDHAGVRYLSPAKLVVGVLVACLLPSVVLAIALR